MGKLSGFEYIEKMKSHKIEISEFCMKLILKLLKKNPHRTQDQICEIIAFRMSEISPVIWIYDSSQKTFQIFRKGESN